MAERFNKIIKLNQIINKKNKIKTVNDIQRIQSVYLNQLFQKSHESLMVSRCFVGKSKKTVFLQTIRTVVRFISAPWRKMNKLL